MKYNKIIVAGAQIPVLQDISINHESILNAINAAVNEKADILLTPEGSLSGYTADFQQDELDYYLDKLVSRARSANLGLAIGTCYRESSDNGVYNQIRFYDKSGEFIGFHSKILRTISEKHLYKSAGLRVFNFEGILIGGLICNDLWANPECTSEPDPHLTRELKKLGAKIIFHAVNGGRSNDPFMDIIRNFHEANLRMRARADDLWIVTVDNCFPFGTKCSSYSGVIKPDGNWKVQLPLLNDDVFTTEITLE
ncbi:MAG: carbon-nitrogen hydrolase family protein [Promethearchaeota archaeon]